MANRTTSTVRGALQLGALALLLAACGGVRASSVPLGGSREEEPRVASAARAQPSSSGALPVEPVAETEDGLVDAEEVPVVATSESLQPPTPGALAGTFQVKPYHARQKWTRVFDLDFALKVGPGGSIDMKMTSHQEAQFEVLTVTQGAIDKLAVEYSVYTSTMTIMGASQESPEELAGKRFIITFAHGQPDVRDAAGGKPPKKQVDSVKDDAREPQEIEKALRELSLLAAKGQADFSQAGAVALAGGEDDDTKVSAATARLRQVTSASHNDKLALLDLGYTLTNAVDDKVTVEVQVAGSLSVLDAPARYQTSTLQGPMEIRSADPGGLSGRGTINVTTSYSY